MANSKKLFEEFPPVSTKEWEEKINIDLKGADYDKKLVWKSIEGVSAKPYYRSEDLKGLEYFGTVPGSFPFTRSLEKEGNNWEIRQDIVVDSIKESNSYALKILNRGVNSIGFNTNGKINSKNNLSELLNEIHIDCIGLHILSGRDSLKNAEYLSALAKEKSLNADSLKGSFDYDPLGELISTGNFYQDEETDLKQAKQLVEFGDSNLPNYKMITVNTQHFKNAGSSIVQELAFGLAMGVEYLNKLTESGLSIDQVASKMQFSFATGSNYFMEIAKLRAARFLWAKIVEAYKPANDNSAAMQIHSLTAEWNKTVYDINVNILRATTESMSAILGGANSLCVNAHDVIYESCEGFSDRIASNIQIILKEEAYFDKTVDPSAGSYYIENLTNSIANAVWELFLETEKQGGFISAFKSEFIQNKINETADIRRKNVATRREILLGTNQYANAAEEKKNAGSIKAVPTANANVIAKPLGFFRAADDFEALRLETEKMSKTPSVFLLTYGNLTMRKARASFSNNFFACAGFEVTDNNGFATIEEGVKAATDAKADIVVLCSSDDEYVEAAPKAYEMLKDEAVFVVAGMPKSMDSLKEKGIEHFIHMRSNVLEELRNYQSLVK